MTHFETAFDGSQFHISAGLVIGFLLVGVGVLLLLDPPAIRRWTRAYRDQIPIARLGLASVICASLWIAFVVMGERYANAKCSALLSSENFKIAEGPIYNVWYRPKSEGFSVANVNFSYSYFVITGGFNGSLFENPIREGEYVRIYYVGNLIIKMQIRQ
jgi:hypothetical protein